MKCSDFHEHVSGYVLDALSEDERAACARHLREEAHHDGCLEALTSQRRVVLALPNALSFTAAPAALWSLIAGSIGGVIVRWPGPVARERIAYAMVAAACVGLLYFAREREQLVSEGARRRDKITSLSARFDDAAQAKAACLRRADELEHTLELSRDALALAGEPSTHFVALAPLPGKAYGATALIASGNKRVLVLASAVSKAADKDLQLWTLRGGTPEPAGFLRVLASGMAVGEIESERLAAGLPDAFAVSLEPRGGSSTPSDVLMVGKVVGT
jgi:anti-sigma-K factor RskA